MVNLFWSSLFYLRLGRSGATDDWFKEYLDRQPVQKAGGKHFEPHQQRAWTHQHLTAAFVCRTQCDLSAALGY